MVTETGAAAHEDGSPSAGTGDSAGFCGYDPQWVGLPVQLSRRINKEYGGITLFGPCPRCNHPDGINVFIPTTWATATATTALFLQAAAFVHPNLAWSTATSPARTRGNAALRRLLRLLPLGGADATARDVYGHDGTAEVKADVNWSKVHFPPPGTTADGLEAERQKAEAEAEWSKVQWPQPGTTADAPKAQQQEIGEVIVCRCGEDSRHKPPSGKAGCGYWTYLRLQKGTIPDGN